MERLDGDRDSGNVEDASNEGWSASTLVMCCSNAFVDQGEKECHKKETSGCKESLKENKV